MINEWGPATSFPFLLIHALAFTSISQLGKTILLLLLLLLIFLSQIHSRKMKLLFFFFLSSFSLKNYTLSMSFTQPVMKTLLSSCLFLSLLIPITEAQLLCNRDNNYTKGSQYQSNLKLVINSLVSNITTSGFYMNISAGTVPDKVYGLLQCRVGISPDECQSCAHNSSAEVVKQCSYNKEGVFVNAEACVVRYAGTDFFGIADTDKVLIYYNTQNRSDQVVFRNELDDLLDKLSAKAVSEPGMFSSGSNFSKNDIYGMVQCTRDLSEASCLNCLQRVRSTFLKTVGGLYVSPSCLIRYEIYPFLSIPPSSSPPTNQGIPPSSSPPTNQGIPPSSSPPTNQGIPPSSTNQGSGNENNWRKIILATVIPTVIVSIFVATTCVFLLRRKHRRKKHGYVEMDINHTNSLTFHLNTLRVATNNFSESNKLGEGGFGSVYKGNLPNGREIAVKRLSKKSRQGLEELKTEVEFVAQLQHRNLVRLLGFCLEEEENLLVYEHLPNGSLDKVIFDESKRLLLDWDKRYKIIEGFARGLLYLHQDSQLRIIHRDLKPSNILLDTDMLPKISDFGLARLFLESHIKTNTERVAGTYGYMAPEYVTNGEFSTKSDVFSFGVIVLEIVMGQKNSCFLEFGNLVSYAWRHWKDGTSIELVDPTLSVHQTITDILKCIHIGLLCVQEDPYARPPMSKVLLWLNSHNAECPNPSRPAYFVKRDATDLGKISEISSVSTSRSFLHQSVNEVTITDIDPR